jgi:hypothetical protein
MRPRSASARQNAQSGARVLQYSTFDERPGSAWGLRPGVVTHMGNASGSGVSVLPFGEGVVNADRIEGSTVQRVQNSAMRGGKTPFTMQQEEMRKAKMDFYSAHHQFDEAAGRCGSGVGLHSKRLGLTGSKRGSTLLGKGGQRKQLYK